MLAGCADDAPAQPDASHYNLAYRALFVPEEGIAEVEIQIRQDNEVLRALDFNAPASRFSDFEGDGSVAVADDRVLWTIPEAGGTLRYNATIDSLRRNAYDAKMTENWVVMRLDDLFPTAKVRGLASARTNATMTLSGPANWSFETPYGPSSLAVHPINRDRIFPRPVGWMAGGEIGIRRDQISDREVAIAAPVGEGFRRQDMLAFLRWTLPSLIEVFPDFTERLLIVGSGQDMWRGGLSGPSSLYIHPERPLISGNATSTLLHELIHVALGNLPGRKDDWLVEGMAEYYSLELLRRTSGISEARFQGSLSKLADWAERENGHLTDPSTGANTAFAVLTLHDLATNLAARGLNMDDLVIRLQDGELSSAGLESILQDLAVEYELPPLEAAQ